MDTRATPKPHIRLKLPNNLLMEISITEPMREAGMAGGRGWRNWNQEAFGPGRECRKPRPQAKSARVYEKI